jgi:hypothetical protein
VSTKIQPYDIKLAKSVTSAGALKANRHRHNADGMGNIDGNMNDEWLFVEQMKHGICGG